ncbi:hypothetical protein MRB53_005094 [Persea americana]|uniref:Uncharacterized protein n=1 Tax=Persea americana TaxID=3435 RepID=A0ACC2MC25_PERAE|nr:hypothetical protein MRB53_005094 [Persea americana]
MRRSGEDEDEDDGSRRHDSVGKKIQPTREEPKFPKASEEKLGRNSRGCLRVPPRVVYEVSSKVRNVNGDSAYCWYNCTPQKYAPQLITFCHKIDFFDNSFE